MKKKKYLFLILFSLFLIFPFSKVSARNMIIDFDINDKFNYFYEFKNNTPFYNFLLSKGKNLREYLNSYYDSGSDDYMILIYSGSQLNTSYMNFNYIDDTYYIICVIEDIVDGRSKPKLVISSNSMYIDWDGYYKATFYYLDYDANILYAEKRVNTYNNNYHKPVFETDYYDDNNVTRYFSGTYFMSSYYYSTYDLEFSDNYDTDYVVTDFIIDNVHYLFDDNENYSSLKTSLRKFFSFGDLKYYDNYDTFLEYYRLNKYTDGVDVPLSLLEAIDPYQEYPFNENYSSVSLGTIKKSYYFIPKTKDDDNYDLNLYYSTNSENVELMGIIYDITNDKLKIIEDNVAICPLSNNYYKFDFINQYIISTDDDGVKYISNMYNQVYYFYVSGNKASVSVYYDTRAYDIVKYDDSIHSFVNVNTGNEVSFKDSDMYVINYQREKDLTYTSDNDISSYLSLTGIVSNVKSFVSTLSGFVIMVFSLVTTMFVSLPAYVQSTFYFILLAGAIITIYKLIRGS